MARAEKVEILCTITEDFFLVPDKLELRGTRQLLQPFKGKQLMVTIQQLSKKRSDAQNRYYWGVVIPTIRAFWKETAGDPHTPDEVHTFLTTAVLGYKMEVKVIHGIQLVVMNAKRTSEMTTVEFNEAMETIQRHFAELDCIIPEPNQQNFIQDFIDE